MRIILRPIRFIFIVCCFIVAYNWFGGWGLALLWLSHMDIQLRDTRAAAPLP